jgi:hypothetical protein
MKSFGFQKTRGKYCSFESDGIVKPIVFFENLETLSKTCFIVNHVIGWH